MNDQQKRARLRELLSDSKGAIAPGVTDALFARLAQDCGYEAAHLSGNAIHKNFCLPDRNLLTTTQVAQRIGQISEASRYTADRRWRIDLRRDHRSDQSGKVVRALRRGGNPFRRRGRERVRRRSRRARHCTGIDGRRPHQSRRRCPARCRFRCHRAL